ncbi:hypothetical protein [Halarchaeum salinum]|uniref:Uncharacterized protein n=1 Tax=Halarchaeum salinum TaxID=489912 RepID=A0AAV3S8V0_9EURY
MSETEHYARSPITGVWYLIDDYEVVGENGRIRAKGKTEVDVEDVPEEQRRRVEDRSADADAERGESDS